jgi:excisionase family DNA binding protein
VNRSAEQLLATPVGQLLELFADLVAVRLSPSHGTNGTPATSPWLSAASAADYLDWPKQRLYKLTADGAIPHYKQDGRLLFHRQELDRWLADFRQPDRDWMNRENRAISR